MKEEENNLQNNQQQESFSPSPSDQYTAESIKVLEGFEAVRNGQRCISGVPTPGTPSPGI